MTKTHRKTVVGSDEAFHRHYAAIWGAERWRSSLYPALLEPTRYTCLLNRYTSLSDARERVQTGNSALAILELPILRKANEGPASDGPQLQPNCLIESADLEPGSEAVKPSEPTFPPPTPSSNGLMSHWNLDAGSVLVAHVLDAQPGDKILDLCAAPGGKSIATAQRLWPHLHTDDSDMKRICATSPALRMGILHCNEADGPRQRRLAENLRAYLPRSLFDNSQVSALRVDGCKPNAEYELRVKTPVGTVGYDKVLVDAPCSSERHIIHAHAKAIAAGRTADEMTNWRPGSSKRLSGVQIDLLLTGLKALKVGGSLLYATCSIEPTENDVVVEKVLAQVEKDRKKRGLRWNVEVERHDGSESVLDAWAERTKYGWIVLPDHPNGGKWGPLYFAVLYKTQ